MPTVNEVNEDQLGEVDWSRHNLPLGVKIPGEPAEWMTLDYGELKMLSLLLRSRIPVIKEGQHMHSVVSAAESSEALDDLATWCEQVMKWMERKGYAE